MRCAEGSINSLCCGCSLIPPFLTEILIMGISTHTTGLMSLSPIIWKPWEFRPNTDGRYWHAIPYTFRTWSHVECRHMADGFFQLNKRIRATYIIPWSSNMYLMYIYIYIYIQISSREHTATLTTICKMDQSVIVPLQLDSGFSEDGRSRGQGLVEYSTREEARPKQSN